MGTGELRLHVLTELQLDTSIRGIRSRWSFTSANTFERSLSSRAAEFLPQGGPRPIDEKKLDLQAAFLELSTAGTHNWIKIRAGRQELEYGSGRLVDVREGPNVRFSFDGFKVMAKINSWRIDGFARRPDVDKPGFFDNVPNHEIGFWGVYAPRPLSRTMSLDVYYLGLNRKHETFQRGTAQEVRHSVGARVSRPIATERSGWDFDYEALWQFGSFGSAKIRAWTMATENGFGLLP
jgi:hypothetical protein